MRKIIISVVSLLLVTLAIQAQNIRVTSAPDTTAILIGDHTGFTVTAELPAGISADLSAANDTLAGKIVILRRDPRDTVVSGDGTTTITDRYLVTAFDTGSYSIPPFYAEVVSGDSVLRFYSDYSFLDVRRPDVTPSDTTDVIFDIVPPRNAPVTFAEIIPWLVITLVAAAVIYLLARFLPRNPLRRLVRPPAPKEPAHITALRDLQALRADELWQKGEIKEYYSRLSDILRRYIDNRYAISSPELTTDETVRMLHRASVTTPAQMALVKEILSVSDMVKFAKYIPDGGSNDVMHENAVRFVEETREPDAVPGAVAGEKKGEESNEKQKEMTGGETRKGGRHA
jgi:hypothetical protein